ncbi:MAG: gliding motility-associated C-terminal domain-containing protein, partial [Bacteroidota bacterium]|nr:gliding motility-associated C-terminal domain-containing protein [Bacteroidota bacterium]
TKGCDSIIVTVLTVNPKYSTNKTAAICSGDSISIAGTYRKTSGTYNDTLNTTKGCDSIIVTVLTVNPKYTTNKTAAICSGDSIFIVGAYRKTSGTYNDTFSTVKGCDSIISTVLTVNPKYTSNRTATICSGDSISIVGTYRKTSGTYNDTLSTTKGCDSIIVTVLTVNPKYNTNKTAAICSGDSISIAGTYRKTSGTYNDTLSTTKGCDSIIVTMLTVHPSYKTNLATSICMGDSLFIAGFYRTISGTYSDSFTTIKGCDSIISTSLFINPTYTKNVSATICKGDSLYIAGLYRTASGTFADTFTTIKGCDSIIVTMLNVNPVYILNYAVSICNGDSMFIAGKYRSFTGMYADSLKTTKGCDSISYTALTVYLSYTKSATVSTCNGDSLFIAGKYRTIPGTYTDSLYTIHGCDSVVATVFTLFPSIINNLTASTCSGDSLMIAGKYRTIQGTYTDSLITTRGCDSIIVTVFTVYPVYSNNTALAICNGDSVVIGGIYRTTSGNYSNTYKTVNGCDSIIVTVLTVNPLPAANAGVGQTILLGASTVIGAPAIAGNTYSWTPSVGLSSTTVAEPQASPIVTTTYYLTETNTSTGCSKTSTVVITVVPVLDFFNGFSPNGDGYNDYWKIPVLDFYPVNKVQIINRWGNEVWVGDNYDNKTILWTGKNMNGDDLPDGTYYYIVTYGNVDKRGWVIIKR